MASSEKQMIPLEAIPQANEDIQEQPSAKDLVDVKFPSRPRRKVVIILGVIAVLTVVIIAASLIGKYVPSYLRDANSDCKSVFGLIECFFKYLLATEHVVLSSSQISIGNVQTISARPEATKVYLKDFLYKITYMQAILNETLLNNAPLTEIYRYHGARQLVCFFVC